MEKSLPDMEKEVLDFWKNSRIFDKTLQKNPVSDSYIFYDGPPFISGLPHYGHITCSIAKDVIPRYRTMKGKHVERVWGWDAHGLTVENRVQKELGIKKRRDIEKYGLKPFIEACYEYTSKISGEWDWYIDRIGRWVDMKNAYRTTDIKYMESVIWAFSELYKKGLIYEGVYTSLYCPTCGTPVSNFEIAMDNSYREVEDPSIIVKFKVVSDGKFSGAYALAWTTTPWTIPSNRALVLDSQEKYVLAKTSESQDSFICAKKRVEFVFGESPYQIVHEFDGKELIGLNYRPPFNFYSSSEKGTYQFYSFEGMVNMEEGTGIVHSAPGFGEVDTEMGRHYGLRIMLSIDSEGKFTAGDAAVNPYEGEHYTKANPIITEDLKKAGLLWRAETVLHRVPFHDRCDTNIIRRAQSSWFVDVKSLKPQLLKNNEGINWIPAHLKNGLFKQVIESAPDWCISRDRFWATPMPVWESEDGERVVISSIAELEALSAKKVTDLHRPFIDEITFEKDGKKFTRRSEVLDSWFEAGSMSYAQFHYPFENKEKFEANYPGDFIVEYLPQTRAWFYVMHVLSTALFGSASFSNALGYGTLAGNDGRKMSKTYGNFEDPKSLLENVGGDAMRLYFMGSPLMLGENAALDENDIRNKLKKVLNPFWNTVRFFDMYAEANGWSYTRAAVSSDILDRWIKIRVYQLYNVVDANLSSYSLPQVVRAFEDFVDDLSRWYLRRSRERISQGDTSAMGIFYEVLRDVAHISAPLIPFLTESIYFVLQKYDSTLTEESIHLREYPVLESPSEPFDDILSQMEAARDVSSLLLAIRTEKGIGVRQVLGKAYVTGVSLGGEYATLVCDEANIKELLHEAADSKSVDVVSKEEKGITISLDTEITEDLRLEGAARELIRQIQDLRKSTGLSVKDQVVVTLPNSPMNIRLLDTLKDVIAVKVLARDVVISDVSEVFITVC